MGYPYVACTLRGRLSSRKGNPRPAGRSAAGGWRFEDVGGSRTLGCRVESIGFDGGDPISAHQERVGCWRKPASERSIFPSFDSELCLTGTMTLSAEQILDQVRALSPAERLYVVERIIHDVAVEVTPNPPPAATSKSLGAVLDALKPLGDELPDVDETLGALDDIEL